MAEYNLAVIPGDGVGPEVVAEGRKVLDAPAGDTPDLAFQYTEFPWGSDCYRETGRLMPEDGRGKACGRPWVSSALWARPGVLPRVVVWTDTSRPIP